MNGTDSGHDDERRSNADPWIKTVGDVAAPLLAGFSLASVITVRLFHPGYASRTCKTWMALAS